MILCALEIRLINRRLKTQSASDNTTDMSKHDESLKAYLAPTGLVSEPRGDLTCRGDLRLEVPKTV